MQRVRSPYSVALPTLALLAVLSLLALVWGTLADSSNSEPNPARLWQIAGILLGTLSALLWLGIWVYARKLRAALAELRAGQTLGSWTAQAGNAKHVIDVGPTLAVVDGELLPFAVHFQSVSKIVCDGPEQTLFIHGVYNNGNGDVSFSRRLPFDADTRGAAETCGQALAGHHGVGYQSS